MEKVTKPEVGQILYSSWGYDQTNIDFYQIVRVSDKGTVWILPMSKQSDTVGWEQYSVLPGAVRTEHQVREYFGEPNDNGFQDYRNVTVPIKPSRHKWNQSYGGVTLSSYSCAWVWDGKPKHETKYA